MITWVFDLDNTLYKMPQGMMADGLYFDYSILKHDPILVNMINKLSGNKVVFTNAMADHCFKSISKMQMQKSFSKYFHRQVSGLKPHPNAYNTVIKFTKTDNTNSNNKYIFFDDTPINLIMGKKFGWITVLILNGNNPLPPNPYIDFTFADIKAALHYFVNFFGK